jgi:hypothetical protein
MDARDGSTNFPSPSGVPNPEALVSALAPKPALAGIAQPPLANVGLPPTGTG